MTRPAAPDLPERVRVLTCIACGAMGREERCDSCSEHRLPLVSAAEYDELLEAAATARERVKRLAPAVAAFANAGDATRELARDALRGAGPEPAGRDWSEPAIVIGWWCDRCGNVDMPQPCIGVCVWRPSEWVGLALYERRRALAEPSLRAARGLQRFLARAAAVSPRPGHEARNREAMRMQARAALAEHDLLRSAEPSREARPAPVGVAAGAGRPY